MSSTVERLRSAVNDGRVVSGLRRRLPVRRRTSKVKLDASSMADRWDREWIAYFHRAPDYFIDCSTPNENSQRRVDRVRAGVTSQSSSQVSPVGAANPVWDIWAIACLAGEIVDRDVADLGCGAGGIGKTIGYVARSYLGIDYSPLALRVAQLVSPKRCDYLVRTDADGLARRRGTVDTAFSRSVFIHQNFQQAVELATLAAELLREDGILAADFHRPDVDDRGEFVKPPRPAKGDLDVERPTVGFYFTDDEIGEVGRAAGLTLEQIIDAPERNWRVARYRKRSTPS
jgi:SAM-dependent methyltransferase